MASEGGVGLDFDDGYDKSGLPVFYCCAFCIKASPHRKALKKGGEARRTKKEHLPGMINDTMEERLPVMTHIEAYQGGVLACGDQRHQALARDDRRHH